ncbi:MAG TPA: gluconolaconase, partial [Mycobacterium sp.]|nr:gluconolaconase [Mycobacterium sp.]
MRDCLRRKRIGAALAGIALVAACSTDSTSTTQSPAPTAGLAAVTLQVDPDLAQPPFDEPRQAMVPAGWTMSVWARVPKARLAAWAPDGSLLVSVPSGGQVVRIQPNGAGARPTVPLDALDQPHGLAFSGSTLYVAESDQIDAYDYADGAAANRRTVAAGLP